MAVRDCLIPPDLAADRCLPPTMIDHAEIVVGDWPVLGPAQQVVRFEDATPEIYAVTSNRLVVPVFALTNRSKDGCWLETELFRGRRGNVTYQTRPIIGGTMNRAFGPHHVPVIHPVNMFALV